MPDRASSTSSDASSPDPPDPAGSADRPGPWASGRFDIEGHRGAAGLVVENTLPGFRAAIDAGVTGVELDVRLSGDGHLVVWHDAVLLPHKCVMTGADLVGAKVADLTLEQLRTVDIGSRTQPGWPTQRAVPGERMVTLPELLELVELVQLPGVAGALAPQVWWTIELKSDPTDPGEVASRRRLVESVLTAAHDAGIEARCFVHSFDWAVLDVAAELARAVLRSALVEEGVYAPGSPWTGSVRWETRGDDLVAAVADLGAQVVSPAHVLVDEAFVRHAHECGIAVLPWTVNEPTDLRAMVDAGVDGIVTDYPDRAREVLGLR